MKILFSSAISGSPICRSAYRNRSGMPLDTFDTLAGLEKDVEWVSPNNGNTIHAESAAKIFECDRIMSTIGRAPTLHPDMAQEDIERVVRSVDREFDAITLNFANIIHSKDRLHEAVMTKIEKGFASTATLLDQLKTTRIYAFGIGLQDEMPPLPESIGPNLHHLLNVLNKKAMLFGTRGFKTEKFLHDLGFTNAVALGCPSLYVNPYRTLNLTLRPFAKDYRITAAGRLSINGFRSKRIQPMLRLASTFDTDYAFQNDLYDFFPAAARDSVPYNSESHEVDKAACDIQIKALLRGDQHFRRYYYFRTPQAWRAYAGTRDAYLGDRFHGGITFLQVGLPAGFIYDDVRVLELTGYFGLQSFTPTEVVEMGPEGAIEKIVSKEAVQQFRDTYQDRIDRFRRICGEAGLAMKYRPDRIARAA